MTEETGDVRFIRGGGGVGGREGIIRHQQVMRAEQRWKESDESLRHKTPMSVRHKTLERMETSWIQN